MKCRYEWELASLEELANKGKLTCIMDIMNINTFSLLGRFGDFGRLFAVQYYKIDIGKQRMSGELFDDLLIKQKNREAF